MLNFIRRKNLVWGLIFGILGSVQFKNFFLYLPAVKNHFLNCNFLMILINLYLKCFR